MTSYKTIIKQGDSLKILEPLVAHSKIKLSPSSLPLSILYEDSDLIVVHVLVFYISLIPQILMLFPRKDLPMLESKFL